MTNEQAAGDAEEVVVGRVGRAHGLRGEVFVEPRTDEPDRRFALGAVLAARAPDGATRPGGLVVAAARTQQGRLVLAFEGVVDRTGAEQLHGTVLAVAVDPAERPDDPEEFYDHQLVGLRAESLDGDAVGMVREVLHTGAQDLLVIDRGGREALVPFVAALVPDVDLGAGLVRIADRPGLLDDLDDTGE